MLGCLATSGLSANRLSAIASGTLRQATLKKRLGANATFLGCLVSVQADVGLEPLKILSTRLMNEIGTPQTSGAASRSFFEVASLPHQSNLIE